MQTSVAPGDSTIAALTKQYQHDISGHEAAVSDSTGTKARIAYDPQGREIRREVGQADGTQTITTKTCYDSNGNETEYVYDGLNRLKETKHKVTLLSGAISTQTSTSTYDKNGNLLTAADWLGNITTYTYDERNRLVSTTNASGIVIEKLEYDASDKQTTAYDALNRKIAYAYDRNNG